MVYHWLKQLPHRLQQDCLLCHCPLDEARFFGLCSSCRHSLPLLPADDICQRCALPVSAGQPLCGHCLRQPPFFDASICAMAYQDSAITLVHRLKQHHDRAICRLLAELLTSSIGTGHATVDTIIAAPMHWRRNLAHGGNHSRLLAQAVARQLACVMDHHSLVKIRHTPPQRGLNARQRHRNLHNAFAVRRPVAGRHVMVIDDVMTTTSTMNEIARTLKQAGAASVTAVAAARAIV